MTTTTLPYTAGMTPPFGATFGRSYIYRSDADGLDYIVFDGPTADSRAAAWADRLGCTVDALHAHTDAAIAARQARWHEAQK